MDLGPMRKSYRGDQEVQPLPPGHEKGVPLSQLPGGWRSAVGPRGPLIGQPDLGITLMGKRGFQRQQLRRKT